MSNLKLEDYQVDTAFPPDKTDTWKDMAQENDHWVLSHNSLRGEIEELNKCVTALEGKEKLEDWQKQSLATVWKYHSDHVDKHHKSEEEILEPFVSKRAKFPDTVSGGHKDLVEKLTSINKLVVDNQESFDLKKFTELFNPYKELLLEHLKEEETMCLPLIRAYFTPEEFKTTGKAMGKEGGHAGSFVYYIGEEKFRNETMPSMGIPFFVWHLAFSGAVKEYQSTVLKNVQAIVDDKEPQAEGKWLGIF